MANHKSALKRARQNEQRRVRNKAGRSALRTSVKKFETALEQGEAADLPTAMSALAGAAAKGYIPKKRAARKIGRLAKRLDQQA